MTFQKRVRAEIRQRQWQGNVEAGRDTSSWATIAVVTTAQTKSKTTGASFYL